MSEINLLPEDFRVKGSVKKLSLTLKKISTISLSVFVVVTILIISLFVYYSELVRRSVNRQDDLKAQIESLSGTEERLVVVQDRLSHADRIFKTNMAYGELEAYEKMLQRFDGEIELTAVSIDSDGISITIEASRRSLLYRFLDLLDTEEHQVVFTDEIKYSTGSGFETVVFVRI